VGRIALTTQLTASILQPIVGFYTDRHPKPYSLAVGMGVTMIDSCLRHGSQLRTILAAAALVGIGSAVFHPESSRIARLASGGQHVWRSPYSSGRQRRFCPGPLLAWAFISGQSSIAWFSLLALIAIVLLTNIGHGFASSHASSEADHL